MVPFDETRYPTSKTVGMVTEVTLITPIKQGRVEGEYRTYKQRLTDVLDGLQGREAEGKPTPIGALRQIHFARWVILDPPPGGGGASLLFTSNFDGEMRHYFRNFALELTDDIDRVWENCEGYPGAHDFDRLWQYVKQHQIETRAFFSAYRDLTVPQIGKLKELKDGFDRLVDRLAAQTGLVALAADPLARSLRDLLESLQPHVAPGRERTVALPAAPAPPPRLERDDIQVNIVGSPPWQQACYCFLRITDAQAFKAGLRRLVARGQALGFATAEDFAREKKDKNLARAFNVAFTWSGLEALGLAAEHLGMMPLPFRQGMAARARILGDVGDWAPERWEGVLGRRDIHAVVATFTMGDENDIEAYWRELAAATRADDGAAGMAGCEVIHRELGWRTERHGYAVEPFGFRHGISQPVIEGAAESGAGTGGTAVAAGEFILGYPDADGNDQVASATVGEGFRQLCTNGSFMVFRKLEQDVAAFEQVRRHYGDNLAHRLLGRRPDGTSLARPDRAAGELAAAGDEAAQDALIDNFTYSDDMAGRKCPFASHVRRANPRDDLPPDEWRRRRIIRRGIPYEQDGRKGVLFFCFNARIDTQFEFLQSEWCSKGDFLGHFTEVRDPIAGAGGVFVDPAHPAPLSGIHRFVTVKGGEYFFAPGVKALQGLLEGRFDAAAATLANAPAEDLSPDTLDPVAYTGELDARGLLLNRRIDAQRVSWPSGETQAVYYVACQDHVRALLADDNHFGSAQYARRIERLLDGYDLSPWCREGEAPPDRDILQRVLLGMAGDDPEKQARLAILKKAMSASPAAIGQRIAEIVGPMVEQAIAAGRESGGFDLVSTIAYAVPLQRAIHFLGAPAPVRTAFSDAYVALYFARTSIDQVRRLGWLSQQPAYSSRQGPTQELFGLVHPIAVFLLIDNYDTPSSLAFAKVAVRELLDRIAHAAMAEEDRIAAGTDGSGGATDSLLSRMLRCRGAEDPATFRLRVGMILAELIVGGIDTAAKAITNVVDCLLSQPEALARARVAVEAGDDAALTALILEALRLQPVAPLIVRECPKEATKSLMIGDQVSEYRFEAGSRLFLLTQAAMRDPGGRPTPLPLNLSKFLIDGTDDVPAELAPELESIRLLNFGDGAHGCFGREIVLAEVREVLRHVLKLDNLRRAAGPEGQKQEAFSLPVMLKVRFDPTP